MEIGPLVVGSVLSIEAGQSIAEAARRMARRGVGSAVVTTDQGQPGIITERDVLRAVANGGDLERTLVGDYMTAKAITASPSWDVREAARTMFQGGFRHLIVLNANGGIAGVLSIRDLVGALLEETAAANQA